MTSRFPRCVILWQYGYHLRSKTPSLHVFALFNNKVIVTVITIMIKTLKIQWYRIILLLYSNLKIFCVSNVKRKRNAENTLCPLILTFYNSSVFAVTTVICKETLQIQSSPILCFLFGSISVFKVTIVKCNKPLKYNPSFLYFQYQVIWVLLGSLINIKYKKLLNIKFSTKCYYKPKGYI